MLDWNFKEFSNISTCLLLKKTLYNIFSIEDFLSWAEYFEGLGPLLPLDEGLKLSESKSLNSWKLSRQSKFLSPSSTRASRHSCL